MLLQGYLMKEKSKAGLLHGLTGDINKRYFKVEKIEASDELALCYYKSQAEVEVRGWIYLKDITEIAEDHDTIVLTSAARTLHLYAPTRAEHNSWVTGLAALCPQAFTRLGRNARYVREMSDVSFRGGAPGPSSSSPRVPETLRCKDNTFDTEGDSHVDDESVLKEPEANVSITEDARPPLLQSAPARDELPTDNDERVPRATRADETANARDCRSRRESPVHSQALIDPCHKKSRENQTCFETWSIKHGSHGINACSDSPGAFGDRIPHVDLVDDLVHAQKPNDYTLTRAERSRSKSKMSDEGAFKRRQLSPSREGNNRCVTVKSVVDTECIECRRSVQDFHQGPKVKKSSGGMDLRVRSYASSGDVDSGTVCPENGKAETAMAFSESTRFDSDDCSHERSVTSGGVKTSLKSSRGYHILESERIETIKLDEGVNESGLRDDGDTIDSRAGHLKRQIADYVRDDENRSGGRQTDVEIDKPAEADPALQEIEALSWEGPHQGRSATSRLHHHISGVDHPGCTSEAHGPRPKEFLASTTYDFHELPRKRQEHSVANEEHMCEAVSTDLGTDTATGAYRRRRSAADLEWDDREKSGHPTSASAQRPARVEEKLPSPGNCGPVELGDSDEDEEADLDLEVEKQKRRASAAILALEAAAKQADERIRRKSQDFRAHQIAFGIKTEASDSRRGRVAPIPTPPGPPPRAHCRAGRTGDVFSPPGTAAGGKITPARTEAVTCRAGVDCNFVDEDWDEEAKSNLVDLSRMNRVVITHAPSSPTLNNFVT